jgi:hypothetical protein
VVRAIDGDDNEIPAGGNIIPNDHGDGDVTDGTGVLDGVAHVEAIRVWGGITAASNPAAVEILSTRGSPNWTIAGELSVGLKDPADSTSPRGRANVNIVTLPDEKICIIGGKFDHKGAPHGSVFVAELYNPADGSFTTMASQARHRGYHSVALLLPDARVLVAGSGRTLEFYSPPYLFQSPEVPRLELDAIEVLDGPERHVRYGGVFRIRVNDRNRLRRIVLMRPSAVTHHTDTDQRLVPVSFTPVPGTDDRVEISVPADASVLPPGYAMVFAIDNLERPCVSAPFIRITHRQCELILNRSTFSRDEAQTIISDPDGPTIDEALYIHVDGFLPGELGIGDTLPEGSAITGLAPALTPPPGIDGIRFEPTHILPEDPDLDPRLRQRFTFVYRVRFLDVDDFPNADTGPDTTEVELNFEVHGHRCRGLIRLVDKPNPYMLDGSVHWLSVDLRVFRLRDGLNRFGRSVGGDPLDYIREVTDSMTVEQFESLPEEGEEARLNIATHEDGEPVWNFAVAQVRYRGSVGNHAPGVRCFFRMFQTAVANLAFKPETTYRSIDGSDGSVPLLGHLDSELVTIPFFAHPRAADMTMQEVQTRQLEGTGDESTSYFGAWLDINQPTDYRFKEHFDPTNHGPFVAGGGEPLRSVQQLVTRGEHQCLVAEVFFGDLIQENDSPSTSDKLAQRNLAYVPADNPGSATSRVVQHTFDLSPTMPSKLVRGLMDLHGVLVEGPAEAVTRANAIAEFDAAPPTFVNIRKPIPRLTYDALIIDWGGLPPGSEAELYMPLADIDRLVALHRLRYGPEYIERVDASTIRMPARGATHLPFVPIYEGTIAGLLTIRMPDTIISGEHFRVVVHHVDGRRKQIVGAFEFSIPVHKAADIAPLAANTYAVLQWVGQSIAPASRWYPVFARYLEQLGDRVTGLGTDASTIPASPAGTGLVPTKPGDQVPDKPGAPTDGLTPLDPPSKFPRVRGRVARLLYDCFGAFEGFVLETCNRAIPVRCSEPGIERIVRLACHERSELIVYFHPLDRGRVWKVALVCR